MVWQKMKNLILMLLVITNFFLATLVRSQEVKLEAEEQTARELALSFVNQRGLSLDDALLPLTITLQPLELAWNRQNETQYATLLLESFGDIAQESLGGDIVRYYNQGGEIRFHDNGEFYATFSPLSFQSPAFQHDDFSLEFLSQFGFEGHILEETATSTGEVWVTIQQLQEGIPVLGCEVVLRFEGTSLIEVVQGKRLEGEFTPLLDKNISVATALIQCFNELQTQQRASHHIFDIQPCYVVNSPMSSDPILTPGWTVTTDSGTFFLNTQDGTLSIK